MTCEFAGIGYARQRGKEADRMRETAALGRKIYLELESPTEEDARGDRERILEALSAEYGAVRVPLAVLRTLYPMCREADWRVTVTLGWNGDAWEALRVEPGDTAQAQYGLAVDYGSTTLVMQVVDLATGEVVTQQSVFNAQIRYGEEILSRIFYTKDNPEHLAELQRVTAECFNELIAKCERASGIPRREYLAMTVGGNTTMIHFLLGIYPWPVFETPYAPVAKEPDFVRASELGIDIPGYVYLYPAAANYLGGDIVSGLVAAGIDQSDELSVFIDIGTNGELVAGNSEFLLAGAGAAGPALEGGISRYGMRADTGAVDRVRIRDGKLELHVIGETEQGKKEFAAGVEAPGEGKKKFAGGVEALEHGKEDFVDGGERAEEKPNRAADIQPCGICGSGIVDLLAELFLNGWVDSLGKFNPDASERIISVKNHLDENLTELAVCYAWASESAQGEDLVFTQTDVTEFIRTKAAAHTMVEYLIEEFGLQDADLARFYLAGAFGKFLDVESAVTIGMYPDLPRERFVMIGNASLLGAYEMLLDMRHLEDVKRILGKITYIQFGSAGDFVGKMHAAQFLPYTDLEQYPSVKERLAKHRGGQAKDTCLTGD